MVRHFLWGKNAEEKYKDAASKFLRCPYLNSPLLCVLFTSISAILYLTGEQTSGVLPFIIKCNIVG